MNKLDLLHWVPIIDGRPQLIMPNTRYDDICSLAFLWSNLQQLQEVPIHKDRIYNFLIDIFEKNPDFHNAFQGMSILRRQRIERQYARIDFTCIRCRTPSRVLCHTCDECAIALWQQGYWDVAPIVNQFLADAAERNQIRDVGNADIIALVPFAI